VGGALLLLLLGACATGTGAVRTQAPAAAPVPKPAEPPSSNAIFERGVEAFSDGRFAEAEQLFSQVLAQHPESANARFDVGLAQERQGKLEQAQESYGAVLEKDPGHVPSLLNLGRLYREAERLDDAIALYERALAEPKSARHAELLNNLSEAYRLKREFAKAEEAARRVLERSEDHPGAYKSLALIHLDQGHHALARFFAEKAQALDADDPGICNTYGLILLAADDRAGALAQFRKAVSLSADFAPGHVNLGALALRYRDYAAAEASFARAVELEPSSAEAWRYLAWARDGQKGRTPAKGQAAAEAWEKVLSLKGEDPDAVCGAGWAWSVDRSGFARARPLLERCAALEGTAPAERARIESKLKAIASLERAAQQPAAGGEAGPEGQAEPVQEQPVQEQPGPEADGTGVGGAGEASPAAPPPGDAGEK